MKVRRAKIGLEAELCKCLLVIITCAIAFCPQDARAVARQCKHNVVVFSSNSEDANTACEAANSAKLFLQELGLVQERHLRIEIIEKPNDEIPIRAYGCYNHRSKIVSVLSYGDCAQVALERLPYGLALTREMYKSFIVHEVGHAVVEENRLGGSVSRLAHECMAYITQFGAMTTILRKQILDRFEHLSISSLTELSTLTYLMSPDVFAVKCYKYFLNQSDKKAFISDLLVGRIKFQMRDVHP